jgi:hypothetical protein
LVIDEQLDRKRTKMNKRMPRFIPSPSFWIEYCTNSALDADARILCSYGQMSRLLFFIGSHRNGKEVSLGIKYLIYIFNQLAISHFLKRPEIFSAKRCQASTRERIREVPMQQGLRRAFAGRSMCLIFLFGLLVTGCAHSTVRYHPHFSNYRQSMGVMLVLQPEIRIFEQLSDGSRLFLDIQSRDAQRRAQASIVRQLGERHFTVRTVSAQRMQQSEYRSVTTLFRSVNRSIQLHTYGPQLFPGKVNAFEYSVGPIADILAAYNADGLVLAIGYQSGAEKPDSNWFSIAVVEPEGRIVWYNLRSDPHQFDLQRAKGVSALVAGTMADFWERGS